MSMPGLILFLREVLFTEDRLNPRLSDWIEEDVKTI